MSISSKASPIMAENIVTTNSRMYVVVLSILILHYNMYYFALYGIEKLLLKTEVSLTSFLQSEVKIIHIIVQNNSYRGRSFSTPEPGL